MWPFLIQLPKQTRPRRGFSLVEVVIAIALTGLLAALAVAMLSTTRVSVEQTKIRTDVVRLNQIISVYLADGGSLDNLTTPQAVIDKLKTVRTSADSKRQVGALTGRGVDVRLTAKAQTAEQVASTSPRAVWNSTTKRFDISTTAGTAGVADFTLDDALLSVNYPTETRNRTTMLYNSANGWLWASGSYSPASFLTPVNATLTVTENVFDPTTPPPSTTTSTSTTSTSTTSTSTTSTSTTSTSTTSTSTTSTSTTSTSTTSTSTTSTSTTSTSTTSTSPTTLPKPINSPSGGTFSAGAFPTSITISNNGAPATGSVLKYRLNNGSWINYTGPVAIASGDKLESKNFTTNAVLYNDSSTDTDTYYKLVASFGGTQVPTWTNVTGGPNLEYTTTNSNPASVTLSHGDTQLDLGGGEYLDAGVENTMTYSRVSPFSNIAPNTDFTLGEMIILNGTTFNDSEATAARLNIAMSMTSPAAQTGTVPVNMTMVSTPNTSDRAASADTVTISNPITSFTVTNGGVTYTLQVRFVSLEAENSFVNGSTLHVYEGASARVALIGKFVSNK